MLVSGGFSHLMNQNTQLQRLVTKICDWAKYHNWHSSKSIRVTKLSFCQNDPLGVHHFGKRTAWSLIYFLIYAYYNISQSQILVSSLYVLQLEPEMTLFIFYRFHIEFIRVNAKSFLCQLQIFTFCNPSVKRDLSVSL